MPRKNKPKLLNFIQNRTERTTDAMVDKIVCETKIILEKYQNLSYTYEQLVRQLLTVTESFGGGQEMISACVPCILETFISKNDDSLEICAKLIKELWFGSNHYAANGFRKYFLDQIGNGCQPKSQEPSVRRINNIQLIGQLYKLNMVGRKSLIECLDKLLLLANQDEESLECLAVLLSIAGPELTDQLARVESSAKAAPNLALLLPPQHYMVKAFAKLKVLSEQPNLQAHLRVKLKDLLQESWWESREGPSQSSDSTPSNPSVQLISSTNSDLTGFQFQESIPDLVASVAPLLCSQSSNSEILSQSALSPLVDCAAVGQQPSDPSVSVLPNDPEWIGPREAGLLIFRLSHESHNFEYLVLSSNHKIWFTLKGQVVSQSYHLVTAKRQALKLLGLTETDYELVPGCIITFQNTYKGKPSDVICWCARLTNSNLKIQPIDDHWKFQWCDIPNLATTLAQSPALQNAFAELNWFLTEHHGGGGGSENSDQED